jgi:hypothetical protein
VTVRAQLLSRAGRVRLERERELAELPTLMRQPGTLAEAPEPVPLHRTNHDATTERTTTS